MIIEFDKTYRYKFNYLYFYSIHLGHTDLGNKESNIEIYRKQFVIMSVGNSVRNNVERLIMLNLYLKI